MEVWKENKQTGLSCGINDFGELFLGNKGSGYNLPDTPENREYMGQEPAQRHCVWCRWCGTESRCFLCFPASLGNRGGSGRLG